MHQAGARFSELLKRAKRDGPQEITYRGKAVAVVLSLDTFERMSHRGESLVAFMQRSPLYDVEELDLGRDVSVETLKGTLPNPPKPVSIDAMNGAIAAQDAKAR